MNNFPLFYSSPLLFALLLLLGLLPPTLLELLLRLLFVGGIFGACFLVFGACFLENLQFPVPMFLIGLLLLLLLLLLLQITSFAALPSSKHGKIDPVVPDLSESFQGVLPSAVVDTP